MRFIVHANRHKPREKLLESGSQVLTIHELLMVILGSGTKGFRVDKLARQLEKLISEKKKGGISAQDLRSIKGLGIAKACRVAAMFELFERLRIEEKITFSTPEAVFAYLPDLRTSQREMIVALYFSARMTLVHKELLAVGSLNQSILEPRDLFLPIQHHPVTGIILAHNHPSGDPSPSEEDRMFTNRMYHAARMMGIELIDHVVVARSTYQSMKKLGMIPGISPESFPENTHSGIMNSSNEIGGKG